MFLHKTKVIGWRYVDSFAIVVECYVCIYFLLQRFVNTKEEFLSNLRALLKGKATVFEDEEEDEEEEPSACKIASLPASCKMLL